MPERQKNVDQARHALIIGRRRYRAARAEREQAEAARAKANAEAGEQLEASDLEGLTAPQKVSAVQGGYLAHLPTPQLARSDLAALTPAEINEARRMGMLADVLAGK